MPWPTLFSGSVRKRGHASTLSRSQPGLCSHHHRTKKVLGGRLRKLLAQMRRFSWLSGKTTGESNTELQLKPSPAVRLPHGDWYFFSDRIADAGCSNWRTDWGLRIASSG